MAKKRKEAASTDDKKKLNPADALPVDINLIDDYAEWLLAHRGTVSPHLDHEF